MVKKLEVIEELEDQKDRAYFKRNMLVSLVSKVFPSSIGIHEGDDWERDWRHIIYVNLPKSVFKFPTKDVIVICKYKTKHKKHRKGDVRFLYVISDIDSDLKQHDWYHSKQDFHLKRQRKSGPKGLLHMVIAKRIFGRIPKGFMVDHIDRNPLNNSRWNLRLVSPSYNVVNSNKKRGYIKQTDSGNYRLSVWNEINGNSFTKTFTTKTDAESFLSIYLNKYLKDMYDYYKEKGEIIEWFHQVSWHIHDSKLKYFSHLESDDSIRWDKHTTDEKYNRIRDVNNSGNINLKRED